jgi:hypothetical protein
MLLLKFYEYTGDRKFLKGVPDAIQWLEKVKLPKNQTDNGRYTHSTFIEWIQINLYTYIGKGLIISLVIIM